MISADVTCRDRDIVEVDVTFDSTGKVTKMIGKGAYREFDSAKTGGLHLRNCPNGPGNDQAARNGRGGCNCRSRWCIYCRGLQPEEHGRHHYGGQGDG
ncbi:hypothetical protein FJ661_18080 [Pseudarthrobacter phenanthrenivorans]|nr:hypothetical protein FJ661_18080 [Pseudarthrobacter phenanthrenivorans]